jgi:hypothetical protein
VVDRRVGAGQSGVHVPEAKGLAREKAKVAIEGLGVERLEGPSPTEDEHSTGDGERAYREDGVQLQSVERSRHLVGEDDRRDGRKPRLVERSAGSSWIEISPIAAMSAPSSRSSTEMSAANACLSSCEKRVLVELNGSEPSAS